MIFDTWLIGENTTTSPCNTHTQRERERERGREKI